MVRWFAPGLQNRAAVRFASNNDFVEGGRAFFAQIYRHRNQVKDFTGRMHSFIHSFYLKSSGKNYLRRDRGNQVWRELSQVFISSLRSFRNLLKSLLNFGAPNPGTLSAIREQTPSD